MFEEQKRKDHAVKGSQEFMRKVLLLLRSLIRNNMYPFNYQRYKIQNQANVHRLYAYNLIVNIYNIYLRMISNIYQDNDFKI